MPSDQTRSSILEAAERLYADRGFADVTLRDIVAAAGVNLAAVNYHFGSKDELIAELFVTRGIATNRERLNELKLAEQADGGRADIDVILRALVGPTLRGCLGPDNEQSVMSYIGWPPVHPQDKKDLIEFYMTKPTNPDGSVAKIGDIPIRDFTLKELGN